VKTELEDYDIEAIAERVAEKLMPKLSRKLKEEEVILGVVELGKYLNRKATWIYKKVQAKTIPYFKSGKYDQFKKSEIDRWIQENSVRPLPELR
jgi:excisionase family DNA binding protein